MNNKIQLQKVSINFFHEEDGIMIYSSQQENNYT